MGLVYIKNTFGPTPVDFAKLTKEMEKSGEIEIVKTKRFSHDMTKYLPLVEADLSLLSGTELAHIDKTIEKYGHKSAKELSDYSHKDIPWIGANSLSASGKSKGILFIIAKADIKKSLNYMKNSLWGLFI